MLVTNFHVKYYLYKLVMGMYQLIDTGRIHPVRERSMRALHASVDYIENKMPTALGFENQREIIDHAYSIMPVDGVIMEFGVYSGGTIRYIAAKNLSKKIYGFDSFLGLPENWGGFGLGKGAFGRGGNMPKVPKNVYLYKGWFSETIPSWRQEVSEKICFIHIDCDIYSSTVDVLEGLKDRFKVGTLILFDEYFNYPGWEQHEYKAWQGFVVKNAFEYEYVAYARQQVLIKITSMDH